MGHGSEQTQACSNTEPLDGTVLPAVSHTEGRTTYEVTCLKPTEQNKQTKQSHRCRQHVDGSLGGGASGCPWKPVSGKGLSLPEASRQHLVKPQRKPGDAPRDPASGSVLSPVGSPAGPPKRPEPPGTCPSPTDVVSQVGPSQPRTVTRRGRESQGRKRVARPRGNKGHALAGTER